MRFDRRWSAHEKVKWCKDANEYHQCATLFITNCTITSVTSDVAQLNVFLDYIEKSANRECPGGLYGCMDRSDDDDACHDKISFFLEKNAITNNTTMKQVSPVMFSLMFFILLFHQMMQRHFSQCFFFLFDSQI